VLIVHLQRIVFNFDTFQNDKLNQHFEFPPLLDLKPYSYQEVMKKENRGKDRQKTADEIEEEQKAEIVDNETAKQKASEADELIEPDADDCYEYKLVGVNVHSGTANAGHYWSYINTVRGMEEKHENDPSWQETENDEWMEYNDSTVKDYKYSELKGECYGDKGGNSNSGMGGFGGFGGWGGKYGKSGYMLFYERKVKKPVKIVVPKEEVEKHEDLVFDKETEEHIKYIPYRDGVDKVKPN